VPWKAWMPFEGAPRSLPEAISATG